MKIILFLLVFLASNIVVASSCNRECRAFSEAEKRMVAIDKCSINCPVDHIPNCYCGIYNTAICSCSTPPKPDPIQEQIKANSGYCVNVYYYKYQGNWWWDYHTHWKLCMTRENGGEECGMLDKTVYITDKPGLAQYSMVLNCVNMEQILNMEHDGNIEQCGCQFK